MRNLAGVPTGITDSLIMVELAKARIPAWSVKKTSHGEVKSTIVGILQSHDQDVVFDRLWYYWTVTLRRPLPVPMAQTLNDRCGSSVRLNGGACIEGDVFRHCQQGAYSYHVDSQEGLNALVVALRNQFDLSPSLTGDNDWINRQLDDRVHEGSLRCLPPFTESLDGIKLREIAGLLALAGVRRPDGRVACLQAALKIAQEKNDKVFRRQKYLIRGALANHYGDETRRNLELVGHSNSEDNNDYYASLAEEALTKRVPLLRQLGRTKEVRAVIRDLLEIRPKLLQLLEAKKEARQADLEQKAEDVDRADYLKSELTCICFRLSALLSSMERRKESEFYRREAMTRLELVVETYAKDIRGYWMPQAS